MIDYQHPGLCRYEGHDWEYPVTFYPVFPRFPFPKDFAEPVSVEATKIEAYAFQRCERRCGYWRVLDYSGAVVQEGSPDQKPDEKYFQ